ncbi:winged helix-turn-helix transcriptional regulator [Dyadobacter frigoris]|nr:helix-turn-helix domain-containing protein [Dyadobacter frigoris]
MATIGKKWKSVIIYTIGLKRQRFGIIHTKMGIISRKIPTEQLKELEEDGIIKREAFKEVPPRVEYFLTDKGLELLPILNMLTEWNLRHNSGGEVGG